MVASLFEERVLASKSGSWLVLCSAAWSTESLAVAPLFGQLSKEYEKCGVQFGETSLAEWPALADQLKVCCVCSKMRLETPRTAILS